MRLNSITVISLVTATICCWQPSSSHGQVREWNASGGGTYSSLFNWSAFNVPDSFSEIAEFNIDSTYDVTFSANRQVSDLLVSDGDVSFSMGSTAVSDATYLINDDLRISGGGFLSLTEVANTFNVGLNILDEVRINSGQMNILSGSQVSNNGTATVAISGNDFGIATVAGVGSYWTNQSNLVVGGLGTGALNIISGGLVSNTLTGVIGNDSDEFGGGGPSISTGTVTVSGPGSTWENLSDLIVGNFGQGTMNIENGGHVSNASTGVIGNSISPFTFGVGTVTVTGAGSTWTNSSDLYVGSAGLGSLNVESGGQVINTGVGMLGNLTSSVGAATVTGAGSTWTNSSDFYVGRFGQGTLNIEAGGQVSNVGRGVIGSQDNSVGTATVSGTGSTWTNAFQLIVGEFGQGTLNIEAGGQVSNVGSGVIGNFDGSAGTATVTGTGSTWTNLTNLLVGISGPGTLNISDSGLVIVGSNTVINEQSSVVLSGGRFEFGRIDLGSYARISGTSGELAGNLPAVLGYNEAGTVSANLGTTTLDVSDVLLTNSGVLFGSGDFDVSLVNAADGEVETSNGERLRFAHGANDGEINNFGGQVRFEQDFTNEAAGFVGGRGQFIANGGWTNQGVMAFSGGFTDVLGDVLNSAIGQIAVGGGSVTTFFDDVTMDASNLNIEVAASGTAVFLGSYNGGNDGTGAVEVLGDLRPGNSPAEVTFAGELTLGSNTTTFIELGGLLLGEYDRFTVADDLNLDGDLMVSLLDDFTLEVSAEFIIAQVDGNLSGAFSNYADGDLVGTFDGTDLFIDYDAGDGNDVALFTAGLPGDYNADGMVDAADYTVWRDGGSPDNSQAGYDLWAGNYGTTTPNATGNTASQPVPEPAAAVSLLLACLGAMVRRRVA